MLVQQVLVVYAFQNIRPDTKVVMKIVSCPPTVQVVVNRPDTKYQLGFSVQNGMVNGRLLFRVDV